MKPHFAAIHANIQGKFTIIKDCAKIADNTIVPPNTVIPALTHFAGSPGVYIPCISDKINNALLCVAGRFVDDLPESTQEIVEAFTKRYYTRFQPLPER